MAGSPTAIFPLPVATRGNIVLTVVTICGCNKAIIPLIVTLGVSVVFPINPTTRPCVVGRRMMGGPEVAYLQLQN